MKDKDIRRLIDACTAPLEKGDSAVSKVSAEEVRKIVMAKVKGEKKEGFSEAENIEYAQPLYVSVNKKEKRRFGIRIAAGSAAACVGIVGIWAYFARAGIGSERLSPEDGEENPITDTAEANEPDAYTVTLLDGTRYTYDIDTQTETLVSSGSTEILKLEGEKLYFTGNGEFIDVAEAAGDKAYYVYGYYNEATGGEHRVFVNNTNEPFYCAYFELYQMEGFKWRARGRNCYEQNGGAKQWVTEALGDIGLTLCESLNDGGNTVDLSGDVLMDSTTVPIFLNEFDPLDSISSKDEEFTLMDGTLVGIDADGEISADRIMYNTLFAMEGDRVFFIGNGEHMDITDRISVDSVFIYPYTHQKRQKTHYIAATGDPTSFGYTEVYPIFDDPDSAAAKWAASAVGLGSADSDRLMNKVVNRLREEYGINLLRREFCEGEPMDLTDFSGKGGRAYSVDLIDGSTVKYPGDGMEVITREPIEILEIQDGCLWIKNKGWDDVNVTEEAQGKEYYIAELGINGKPHIFIVNNTIDPDECGYIDIFSVNGEDTGKFGVGRNIENPGFYMASQAKRYMNWLYEAFEELGFTMVESSEDACNPTEVYIQSDDLPYRVSVSGETVIDEEFDLLDGTTMKISHLKGYEDVPEYCDEDHGMSSAELFENENGRLYFIGNGEHIDITDIIGRDKAYIYSYTHPERNRTHYLIAGGDAENFGYTELFESYCGMWSIDGKNAFLSNEEINKNDAEHFADYMDVSLSYYKPWLVSTLKELDIVPSGGSDGTKDFSGLFPAPEKYLTSILEETNPPFPKALFWTKSLSFLTAVL